MRYVKPWPNGPPNSSQVHNFDGDGYRWATHLAWVGVGLNLIKLKIFAQLEQAFHRLANSSQLSPSCFVIVRWLRGRQTIEWFSCELARLGGTVWPPADASFDFITWLELGVPFVQGPIITTHGFRLLILNFFTVVGFAKKEKVHMNIPKLPWALNYLPSRCIKMPQNDCKQLQKNCGCN